MPIDRFDAAQSAPFVGFNPEVARRYFRGVTLLGNALKVRVDGLGHIPSGRALLVANHAFGWDVVFPMAAIAQQLERTVWVLGDNLWWKVPFLRNLAASLGVVDGTQENADRLLERDQLVLVLPGGMREAVKPQELRYQLLWGHRYGFVQTALRNSAPMVPLASIGTDELFDFMGNSYARGARWLGRRSFPIPLPTRILPVPHFVQPRFLIGEPVPVRYPPEAENDVDALHSLRREVEGSLHELIALELARRAGIDLR